MLCLQVCLFPYRIHKVLCVRGVRGFAVGFKRQQVFYAKEWLKNLILRKESATGMFSANVVSKALIFLQERHRTNSGMNPKAIQPITQLDHRKASLEAMTMFRGSTSSHAACFCLI